MSYMKQQRGTLIVLELSDPSNFLLKSVTLDTLKERFRVEDARSVSKQIS
ncbi:uncharacterized protein PHALS_02612 [Plasmopara halstedii]|uniref:Uncharacterized protein n=1 Tax=Plasmopara halstedii TaxID=4781 RepID=A0A0P1AW18_PLAHL|nr:uncharacterized protein PHALS_02612 [Plasmopara halstedii]CEG46197.1 hypothetical protein PHALS_02612 [Plasmopara halstedii]|eukprot:XP_024582566.1 hypothetical protein PHALS_02612 [Plasmopara halstedii]